MYLRIKSAEKDGTSGEGEGVQMDMLRINPQKKDGTSGEGEGIKRICCGSADMLRIESAEKNGTSGENRRKNVLGNVMQKKMRERYRKKRECSVVCKKKTNFADAKSNGIWCPVT